MITRLNIIRNSQNELILENPEIASTMISNFTEKYKPIFYSICNELHNIMKDYANNIEYFETCAKIKKQQFNAYVNAGFTEDQAIAFIINDNLKLMENMKKQTSNINNKR